MEDFQQILPVTKVKRDLLAIIKSMEEDDATIALTRNGEPVSVMMTLSRYESLLETIDILSDKPILKSLEKSKKDFESGRVLSHDEVWQD
jgi:prevent-host-death family protein